MFDFVYNDFLDKYNGLTFHMWKTNTGKFVAYFTDNSGKLGLHYYTCDLEKCSGSELYHFCKHSFNSFAIMDCIVDFTKKITEEDQVYFQQKTKEIKEKLIQYTENFLLSYYGCETLADCAAIDKFWEPIS